MTRPNYDYDISTSLSMDMEVIERIDTASPCNEDGPADKLLKEHWECFNAESSRTALRLSCQNLSVEERKDQEDTPALRTGEVYGLLDFCCHRAPAWYRSEVNGLLRLAQTQREPVRDGGNCCQASLLKVWQSMHKEYVRQQHEAPRARASAASLKVKLPPRRRLEPTRIQPDRPGKRKARDLDNSIPVKRRKTAANPSRTDSDGTYHFPWPTLTQALHLSMPPTADICGKLCHRSYRSFCNRLIARVASKITGIYSRRAGEKNPKIRRCVLQGYETASPWCEAGNNQTGQEEHGEDITMRYPPPAPEPEMLASPSCANWPPPPKVRVRMAREGVEQNVVEFEGLKFLVDVCGEPPVPRVMML